MLIIIPTGGQYIDNTLLQESSIEDEYSDYKSCCNYA